MKYLKKFNEKFELCGKYIKLGEMSFTSIPGIDEDSAIIFACDDDHIKVYRNRRGIYADTSKYDKYFDTEIELIEWLNSINARYIGIDDRY